MLVLHTLHNFTPRLFLVRSWEGPKLDFFSGSLGICKTNNIKRIIEINISAMSSLGYVNTHAILHFLMAKLIQVLPAVTVSKYACVMVKRKIINWILVWQLYNQLISAITEVCDACCFECLTFIKRG